MIDSKELGEILNLHFLAELAKDVESGNHSALADYNGIMTGLVVALYERAEDKLQASVVNALKVHGIDVNSGMSFDDLNSLVDDIKEYNEVKKEGNVYQFPTPEKLQ